MATPYEQKSTAVINICLGFFCKEMSRFCTLFLCIKIYFADWDFFCIFAKDNACKNVSNRTYSTNKKTLQTIYLMKKLNIYLDTSVISHLDAPDTPEKMSETLELWEMLKTRSDVKIVISELTLHELNRCQQPKLRFLLEKINEFDYLFLEISEDDKKLADHYLDNAVLTKKSIDDLTHIAVATLNDCRYILSWNFKHFVNPKTIHAVWAINKMRNLPEIEIVSPSMMLGGF